MWSPAQARGRKATPDPGLLPVLFQLQQNKTEEVQQQPQPFIEVQSHRAVSRPTWVLGTAP